MTNRIGWIVDAQHDFLSPSGRLYVHDLRPGASDPGAGIIVPSLISTVQWMRANCRLIVYTGDAHRYGDAEIDPVSPDPARGTYPPHCMALEDDPKERAGAAIISMIAPKNGCTLPREATDEEGRAVARVAAKNGLPVLIQKSRFSVFEGNTATDAFVDELARELGELSFVVAGVATDVCVTAAVEGLAERGHDVIVVKNAVHGLGLETWEESLERWQKLGVEAVSSVGMLVGQRPRSPSR